MPEFNGDAMNNPEPRPEDEGEVSTKSSSSSAAEEEVDESAEFLRCLAKMHAEQFFQQIISATGELKASPHLAEATFREITERFASSLSCQVKEGTWLAHHCEHLVYKTYFL